MTSDSYTAAILGLSPVAYWPLDDPGTWADATGHGYNMAATGTVNSTASLRAGVSRTAADLAGGYLSTPDAAALRFESMTSGFTVVLTYRWDTYPGTLFFLMDKENGSDGFSIWTDTPAARPLNTTLNGSTAQATPTVNSTTSAATAYNVAVVYDPVANNVTTYVDGASTGTTSMSGWTGGWGTANTTGQALILGGSNNVPGAYRLDGALQDVAIFNRPLSGSEVFNIYAGAAAPTAAVKDITEGLPFSLATAGAGADGRPWTNEGIKYDFAIGGLPFLSAASEKFPYRRQTAQWRREQLDTSKEPGEQSLTGAWLRSQSSFAGGAGARYLDPTVSGEASTSRFWSSYGIDPWTEGRVSLLKDTDQVLATASNVRLGGWCTANGGGYVFTDGTALKSMTEGGTVTNPSITAYASTAAGGTVWYASATEVRSTTLPLATGSLVATVSNVVLLRWVKQRLIGFGSDGKVYELTGGTPATPIYTHPLGSSWTWTDACEGGAGIFATGYAGDESAVYAIPLNTSVNPPVLGGVYPAVRLPRGETARSIAAWLGSVVVVGTSRGVRVGAESGDGKLTLGPLSVETSSAVSSIDCYGQYAYAAGTGAGKDGASGLWRLDLGNVADDGRAPYASDVFNTASATGTVGSVGWLNGRLLFCVDGSGVWRQAASRLVADGKLVTSRTRFGTTEPKELMSLRVTLADASGAVVLATSRDGAAATTLTTTAEAEFLDETWAVGPWRVADVALEFTLQRKVSDSTRGPVLSTYQLRAQPSPQRQELLQLPLLCFQEERDGKGVRVSRDPYARYVALKVAEQAGTVVLAQDLAIGGSERVLIEQVELIVTNRPASAGGWGGILMVTARTVQ